MAEKVEVIKVSEGGTRFREIARKSPEMHAIGVYKAVQIGSWEVGINTRDENIQKIDKAAKFNKDINAAFEEYCERNKLSKDYTVGAMFRRAAALYVKFGEKHAELYVQSAIPPKYRPFWNEMKEMLKSKYLEVRR
jgi:hypothetical protein